MNRIKKSNLTSAIVFMIATVACIFMAIVMIKKNRTIAATGYENYIEKTYTFESYSYASGDDEYINIFVKEEDNVLYIDTTTAKYLNSASLSELEGGTSIVCFLNGSMEIVEMRTANSTIFSLDDYKRFQKKDSGIAMIIIAILIAGMAFASIKCFISYKKGTAMTDLGATITVFGKTLDSKTEVSTPSIKTGDPFKDAVVSNLDQSQINKAEAFKNGFDEKDGDHLFKAFSLIKNSEDLSEIGGIIYPLMKDKEIRIYYGEGEDDEKVLFCFRLNDELLVFFSVIDKTSEKIAVTKNLLRYVYPIYSKMPKKDVDILSASISDYNLMNDNMIEDLTHE